jgi:hypothetical protein
MESCGWRQAAAGIALAEWAGMDHPSISRRSSLMTTAIVVLLAAMAFPGLSFAERRADRVAKDHAEKLAKLRLPIHEELRLEDGSLAVRYSDSTVTVLAPKGDKPATRTEYSAIRNFWIDARGKASLNSSTKYRADSRSFVETVRPGHSNVIQAGLSPEPSQMSPALQGLLRVGPITGPSGQNKRAAAVQWRDPKGKFTAAKKGTLRLQGRRGR